jgi:uncharacterized protein HemX
MRKILVVVVILLSWGFSMVSEAQAQMVDQRQQRQQLKAIQKRERKSVKIQHKNIKNSWKRQKVSKASCLQAKHQMQRDDRALKERQKNERQDLSDRQRALKENQKIYGQ